ncbi:MAG: ATP-dependent RNA helicase HrpA [Rhodanobacteraceae bacterium]
MNPDPSNDAAPAPTPRALRAALTHVLSRDAGRLRSRLRALERERKPDPIKLAGLATQIETSCRQRATRELSVPAIHIDPSLPIAQRADEITRLIREHQVLVIAGETGSGKTTQLPKLCLAAGRGVAGMIGCTQPRRLAARAMARRVAEELGSAIGSVVGFQVRFTEQVGERALVKFMTDGILLAEISSDRGLAAYDTIILDEAHERSLNIDFLLGYLKTLLRKRRDLKLIVTSATIDTARFARHFDDAPVIEVEGRAYPVEVHYRPAQRDENPTEQIIAALDELTLEDARGDALVFLPGEREIRDAHLALERRKYRHTEILPLYARLSAGDQDRVFKPGAARRIVLATNVAETSLTVPRIRYVIDSGTARVKRYSQRNQIERLHIEPISQAAADQRAGRCGRVGAGVCVRLYDEADYAARPRYTDPEIRRSSLADVILRMLSQGLGDVESFPFIDPPEPRVIADGWRRLAELGAVDDARNLTDIGRQLARIPIDVQLARMLIEAQRLHVLPEVLPVVAFLGTQDPRERPADARAQADTAHAAFADPKSDFVGVLNLWRAYRLAHEELTQSKLRDWCTRHFLNFLRMREWRELHRQLLLLTHEAGTGVSGSELYQAIHCALLAGIPTNVARKDERGVYRGTRERKFRVFPGSALAKSPPQWVIAAQILDLGGKVYGMQCARIEQHWIECQAAHLLRRTCREPHWSRKRGAVIAHEQVTLFGLTLVERRTVMFAKQDPRLAHAIFLREALARCELDVRADFLRANARVLAQARESEAQQRRGDLLKSDEELAAFFTGKLPTGISTTAALEAWYRKAAPAQRAALRWSLADVLVAAPDHDAGAFPSTLELAGHRLWFEYRFVPGDAADGVSLRLPLALLNAIPVARCEWLVPGMLAEKVAALIRGLPKSSRRNVVPAPDFARAFVEAEAPRDQPLAQALAAFLTRATGVPIETAAFAQTALPPHLLMRFAVHDEHGKPLAEGRDLAALRAQWEARAREAFSRKTDAELVCEDVQAWDFDAIPREVCSGGGLAAYPALSDLGGTIALRVFEREEDARRAHRGGVERLLRLSLAPEFKRARRQLPIASKLALQYAPLGRAEEFRDDLVEGGFSDLLAEHDLEVRERAAFQALRESLARGLFAAAMQRLQLAEPIIGAQAELKPWLTPPLLGYALANYDDLHEQMDLLLQSGFLRELSNARLAHLPRYLRAMRLRAEKLREDPARDQSRLLQVLPYWRELWARQAAGEHGEALETLRWLIEEWRVSLFAQELKTAEPVSPKRLARALEAMRQERTR